MVKLIKNTGFRSPLIVSNQSGFLIVGHGRLDAAKSLKMKSVPVIFQDFKNEAEEYAFMCADNAIASWSELDLEKIKDISADEIRALAPLHPIRGKSIPILPAEFVKEQVGTGLVMSVPAHAPYDFLALRDAGKLNELKPIPVLKTPGFGEIPAMDIVGQMHIKSQTDEKAEEATKTLYKKRRMRALCSMPRILA